MKRGIILLLLSFTFCGLQAQDTIVKANGDKLIVKVRDVTPDAVQFKKFSNPDGPLYTINITDIISISYQNGEKEVYNSKPILTNVTEPNIVLGKEGYGLTDQEYYHKGVVDATKYYSSYSSAGTATLLTSLLLNGLFGLIPAVACSATPPKTKNLGCPSPTLLNNPSYYKGYSDYAKKKKSRKVWMNWTIGTVISTVIIVILASGGS